jgi:hypothetical protein
LIYKQRGFKALNQIYASEDLTFVFKKWHPEGGDSESRASENREQQLVNQSFAVKAGFRIELEAFSAIGSQSFSVGRLQPTRRSKPNSDFVMIKNSFRSAPFDRGLEPKFFQANALPELQAVEGFRLISPVAVTPLNTIWWSFPH